MKRPVAIATASPFLAAVIRKTLARSPRLEASSDHRDARAALAALGEPHGLAVLDAELLCEGKDGAALAQALRARRAPTILVDARGRGVPAELAALPAIGTVRGRTGSELDLEAVERDLLAAVGSALRSREGAGAVPPASGAAAPAERADVHDALVELIVLGVSTGGPPLLVRLLADVREPAVPVLVVQHMPASETAGFALRLAEASGLRVREIAAGALPPPGHVGVVRGGSDYRLVRRGEALHLRDALLPGNLFHPRIDEVLTSAAAAGVAVGTVILTGMGQDGAAGALALAQKGWPVVAQRPDTCAVAGMPQAAIENGAACAVQSPEGIASTLNRWSETARRGAGSRA